MKAEIRITSSYGFDHNWTLVLKTTKKTKIFYLGQDVKFCQRVLGINTSDVIEAIGTRNIDEGTIGNKKLADFICNELNLNGRNMTNFEGWSFCCQ